MSINRWTTESGQASPWRLLIVGTLSLLVYVAILWLSPSFAFDQPTISRPFITVLSLFAVAFALYLAGLWLGLQSEPQYVTPVVWLFAVGFRVALLFSEPIQEVDIYRYLWDGKVTNAGVSPFEYAPSTVLQPDLDTTGRPELQQLIELRESSAANRTILERVHYGELPTVYPPVSQAVFSAATGFLPPDATVKQHIAFMKATILVFDLATIAVLAATLRFAGLHVGWLIAYAWCPLVIKEFANSGHLDAIAVFLTCLAVYFCCRAFYPATRESARSGGGLRPLANSLVASVFLGLAVGAKLYAVALIPIMLVASLRALGWRKTVGCATAFSAVTLTCLYPWLQSGDPMIRQTPMSQPLSSLSPDAGEINRRAAEPQFNDDPFAAVPESSLPEHVWTSGSTPHGDRRAGLRAFLSHWMMNDFIFLNLAENITPSRLRGDEPVPWFVVLPDETSEMLLALAVGCLSIEEARVPFVLARFTTAVVFLVLALTWAWRASHAQRVADWLQYVFLTMAWFWLLLPTLNPWYWIWALPWVPFAKNRVWLAMSGLLFVYYLRFYFSAHFQHQQVVAWLPYRGAAFFDFVIVWIEYAPWFLALALNHFWISMNPYSGNHEAKVN